MIVDELAVSFTGISPTAINWHWDFGDGDTSNIQNLEHIYQQQGFYQVCLHVEDTCYFADYCEEIEICIEPPVSGFTYNTDELTVFFQDTSIIAAEYYWDFGDEYFSNLKNPVHIYNSTGNYLVCLMTWNSCGADTICELIYLCIPPVSEFAFTRDDLMVFFENNTVMADEYFWDFGDGYFSTLSDPWHYYEYFGDFQVCLTTWNECGSDTVCEMLNLTTVSINEDDAALFTTYPNPAREVVFLKSTFTGQVHISLLDLSGKEVIKQNMDIAADETFKMPLGQIEPGLYIIRISSGKEMAYGKLVVVK